MEAMPTGVLGDAQNTLATNWNMNPAEPGVAPAMAEVAQNPETPVIAEMGSVAMAAAQVQPEVLTAAEPKAEAEPKVEAGPTVETGPKAEAGPTVEGQPETVATSETVKMSDAEVVEQIANRLRRDLSQMELANPTTPEAEKKRDDVKMSIGIFDQVGFALANDKAEGREEVPAEKILHNYAEFNRGRAQEVADGNAKADYARRAELADDWAGSYTKHKESLEHEQVAQPPVANEPSAAPGAVSNDIPEMTGAAPNGAPEAPGAVSNEVPEMTVKPPEIDAAAAIAEALQEGTAEVNPPVDAMTEVNPPVDATAGVNPPMDATAENQAPTSLVA